MQRRRGALHVHSTISYDGQQTMAELVAFFRARGDDFLCVSEHSDGLGIAQLDDLVATAARHTTDDFVVVPGIEYSCRRRLHLIGFGVTTPVDSDDPLVVAAHIRAAGGVAVVAHPLAYDTDYPEELAALVDGLEIWNITKDGWFAPGAGPLALWREWRARNPALRGFGALDLHSFGSPTEMVVEIAVERLDVAGVIRGLKQGPLTLHGHHMSISGQLPPTGLERWRYTTASQAYRRLRRLRDDFARFWGRAA